MARMIGCEMDGVPYRFGFVGGRPPALGGRNRRPTKSATSFMPCETVALVTWSTLAMLAMLRPRIWYSTSQVNLRTGCALTLRTAKIGIVELSNARTLARQ